MSVNFLLKDQSREVSYINTVVAFKGKYYKRSTGESVPVKKWNTNTQRCITSGFSSGESINKKLKVIFKAACDACDTFVERRRIPVGSEFWQEVDLIMNGGQITPDILFTDYFAAYNDKIKPIRASNTHKKYVTVFNKLLDYETAKRRRLRFEDINMTFYNDFQKFIYSSGYSLNYFGALIQCLKVVYREARDVEKLHNLSEVDYKGFKVTQETADTIYLTEEELLKIYRLEITEELIKEKLKDVDERPGNMQKKLRSMETARAKFLIGAFTALRVSDFNRLDEINLQEGLVKIRTKKTGAKVIIPVHWVIKEILDSGFDLKTSIPEQKINKRIKDIARLAGITEKVEVSVTRGGKLVTEVREKCEEVSTHTCRRSGATNMVKFGISPLLVMKITGHTSWKSFIKYIKISAEENAALMRESGFFDKREGGNKKGNNSAPA